MVPFVLIGMVVAFALEPRASTLAYAALFGLPALLGGIAGAAINTVAGAPDPVGGAMQGLAMPPEMSGLTTLLRGAWPPAISVIACLPVLGLRAGIENGRDALGNSLRGAGAVVILLVLVAGWVRQRDEIHAWFRRITTVPTSTSSSSSGKDS